jgi:cellulase/cellobiase CelA1
MIETNLPGKTAWESQQYRRDHGHRVAAAQAYRYLARRIETDESYPLPPVSEAVIALAAAAMQDVHADRLASAEAYAAGRVAAITGAARDTHARITGRSAA